MTLAPLRTVAQYYEAEVGEAMQYESQREEDPRDDEYLVTGWELDHLVFDVAWAGLTGWLDVGVEQELRECYLLLCVVVVERRSARVALQPH